MYPLPYRTSVLMFLVAATAACSAGGSAPAPSPEPTAASVDDLEAIYRARLDSARTRFTEADARFMASMIHHHAQALEMARLAETNTDSPEIQTLAARIINAQTDEIATMQRWLRDRGQEVPDPAGPHAMHVMMPGMLTEEQMAQLAAVNGREFDRLFLRSMIQHHRGAVAMVDELFDVDGAGQDEIVFKFAADIHADQSSEIARMEGMLEAMTADDRGP